MAALRAEVQRVLDSAPHTHNITLNEAAYALGQLVAGDLLPAELVTEALQVAGEAVGQPPAEAAANHPVRTRRRRPQAAPRSPATGRGGCPRDLPRHPIGSRSRQSGSWTGSTPAATSSSTTPTATRSPSPGSRRSR